MPNLNTIPKIFKDMEKYIKQNPITKLQIKIGNKIIQNYHFDLEYENLVEYFYDNKNPNIDIELQQTDRNIVYIEHILQHTKIQNNFLKIEDILLSLGYAESTVKTTIKKFSDKTLSNNENVFHILECVSKSSSKFKKLALAKLNEMKGGSDE